MEKIVITTDSTADLSQEILDKYQIPVTRLHVLLGEKEYTDGLDVTTQDMVNYVEESGTLPKTSAVDIRTYIKFFKKLLEENDYVIHFTISSKLSSTYSNACIAAQEFNGKVAIIDSKGLSTGQGVLVLKAIDLKNEGKSFNEIVKEVIRLSNHVHVSSTMDTPEYLYKGGRCSGLMNFMAKVLHIHPSVYMSDGTIYPDTKYRGNLHKCIMKYIENLAEEYRDNYDDSRVFISHVLAPKETVDEAVNLVKKLFHFKEVIVTLAGSVVSTHCGPGTLGLFFIAKKPIPMK